MINGMATINVVTDKDEIKRLQSPKGKPFLKVTFEDGTQVDITTNLAEMIGGAGSGLRKRFEDMQ